VTALALVRERDAADERVKEAYRDVKESLRVSFVDAVFQAYAIDPKFLDHTWRRLRPSVLSAPFIAQARLTADIADRGVESWNVSNHAAALHARNYGDIEVRKLREVAEVFHTIHPRLLIIAYAVKAALAGEPVGGGGAPHDQTSLDRGKLMRDFRGVRVQFADDRDAPLRVRTIYEEIARAARQPIVGALYRAMGAYPDWLEIFWSDARPTLGDVRRAALARSLRKAASEAAKLVPYPLNMPMEGFAEMAAVNDALCELLPELAIDGAIARRGLGVEPAS